MELDDIHKQILRNLLYRRCINKKHCHREQALGRLLQDGKRANKKLNDLIKQGFVLRWPTHYGDQFSLNPKQLSRIKELVK